MQRWIIRMNIEQLINQIKLRPLMYIGCFRLEPMFHFINGYMVNNFIMGKDDFIDRAFRQQFNDWIKIQLERKHNIQLEPHRNYLYYIHEIYKDTEDSLKIFFELCDEFFSELHSENNI